jgi:hypothetical protein
MKKGSSTALTVPTVDAVLSAMSFREKARAFERDFLKKFTLLEEVCEKEILSGDLREEGALLKLQLAVYEYSLSLTKVAKKLGVENLAPQLPVILVGDEEIITKAEAVENVPMAKSAATEEQKAVFAHWIM